MYGADIADHRDGLNILLLTRSKFSQHLTGDVQCMTTCFVTLYTIYMSVWSFRC